MKTLQGAAMSRIKLNLRQPIPDKLQTGRQIIAAMTSNHNFPNPHPPLADVTAALATLDEAYKAHQIAKSDAPRTKANVADDAEIQLDSQLRKLAAYVESIADKDETIIASAGLQTKAARTTPSTLPAPAALSATAGDREGEINLTWRKVENSRSYIIQISPDPPSADSWGHAETVTIASKTIENLTSGKTYWFRVAAIGSLGQSGWSELATKVAP
jgi:fibronectin type III domain protein